MALWDGPESVIQPVGQSRNHHVGGTTEGQPKQRKEHDG